MKITLGKDTFQVDKLRLKRWLELEGIREQITQSAKDENREGMASLIYSYLLAFLDLSRESLDTHPAFDILQTYFSLLSLSAIDKIIPLLTHKGDSERNVSWHYKGRTWYYWSHILALSYGWNMEYIAELEIADAVSLLQEILVAEQLQKEWEWMCTEIAYPYDSITKKSKFRPLDRPDWMMVSVEEPIIKQIKMHKRMIPIGNVVWMKDEQNTSIKSDGDAPAL